MTTAWTPGPWIADDFCMQHGNAVRVGTYSGQDDYYLKSNTICECWINEDDDDVPKIGVVTAERNARLIAAAPELYEALAQVLHELIEAGFNTAKDFNWPKAIADARAALAKARGEP